VSPDRRGPAAILALVTLVAVMLVGSGEPPVTGGARSGERPTPTPTVDDPLRVPYSEGFEPYPFMDAPPLERTPLDGSYVRIVTLEELGGPVVGFPTHCRRCVPYEIDPGLETLMLFRGRYFLEHQLTGRRGLGHYVVEGDRIRFFNDPNCSQTVGTYRWRLTGHTLSLEGLADPCPFGTEADALDHRAHDLTFSDWSKVRVCTAQIRSWWPALFSCAEGGSRSS
jgi:hypothetical protein